MTTKRDSLSARTTIGRKPRGKARILVIDDRQANRDFLTTLLRYAGHDLFEASDGQEALDLMIREQPELAIVDVVMPSMDGYEFVRQVRSRPEIVDTLVIFYTASYLESEIAPMAKLCGVPWIITKPAEPQEILATVNSALGTKRPALAPPAERVFDREHLRVVSQKLSQKVDELEALNAELESRVQQRTAELATSNQQLRETNRRKDEMVAIVSHDLRSPLTGLLLIADLLKDKAGGPEKSSQLHFVEMMQKATNRMIKMVTDLLDVARIDAEQTQLEFEPTRISEVIAQSLEALQVTAQAKHVAIEMKVAASEPVVRGDRLKLAQVFNNLLENAVKFTPSGGQVEVAIQPEANELAVRISDTGPGIPANELPLIFEKFRRGSAGGDRGAPGVGLGLAIVKELVELHGGRIEVESVIGRGSTFTVFLPPDPAAIR